MRIRNKRYDVSEGRARPSRPTCMASKTGYKGPYPNICFYFSVGKSRDVPTMCCVGKCKLILFSYAIS